MHNLSMYPFHFSILGIKHGILDHLSNQDRFGLKYTKCSAIPYNHHCQIQALRVLCVKNQHSMPVFHALHIPSHSDKKHLLAYIYIYIYIYTRTNL